jgi:PhnB protein
MASLTPYLHFNGNAGEAFEFYKSVFVTEYRGIFRFKDAPPEHRGEEDESENILNVSLPIGGGTMLMGSDVPKSYGRADIGNNFYIYINCDSREEADKILTGLSKGGQVLMPAENTFWGSYFGMLKDKFNVGWMVSFEQNPQQQ